MDEMKTIQYEGPINAETLPGILFKLDQALENPNDQIRFYLCSGGGENPSALMLQDYLAIRKDRVSLVGYGRLYSNAFNLFHYYKGPKRVLPQTVGMVHHSWHELNSANLLPKPDVQGKVLIGELRQMNDIMATDFSIFLNAKELKRFRKGYDIYLSSNRMNQLYNS